MSEDVIGGFTEIEYDQETGAFGYYSRREPNECAQDSFYSILDVEPKSKIIDTLHYPYKANI